MDSWNLVPDTLDSWNLAPDTLASWNVGNLALDSLTPPNSAPRARDPSQIAFSIWNNEEVAAVIPTREASSHQSKNHPLGSSDGPKRQA